MKKTKKMADKEPIADEDQPDGFTAGGFDDAIGA